MLKLNMHKNEVWTSLLIVWFILTVLCCVFLLSLFVLKQDTIYTIAALLGQEHLEPCILCGMTKALLSISRGDIPEALNYNTFSVFIVLGIVINILSNLVYLLYKIKTKE